MHVKSRNLDYSLFTGLHNHLDRRVVCTVKFHALGCEKNLDLERFAFTTGCAFTSVFYHKSLKKMLYKI